MDELLSSIAAKKERLDAIRPVSRTALLALQKSYDVDLTYTSNAIEGNTLTLRETAEVIEHGITVGGKPLKDHLEAVDHYDALLWMREQAADSSPLVNSQSVNCTGASWRAAVPTLPASTAGFRDGSPAP